MYPVALGGKFVGGLSQAKVGVPCPLLLSRAVLQAWGCNLNFKKRETYVSQFDHTEPFNDKTPVLDLAAFGPEENFDRKKAGIPEKFWSDALTSMAAAFVVACATRVCVRACAST